MEEELRSYKSYMREAIVQYKRQIQELQNQITVLQIADIESNKKDKNNQSQRQSQSQSQNQSQYQPQNQKNQSNETRFPEIPRLKSAS